MTEIKIHTLTAANGVPFVVTISEASKAIEGDRWLVTFYDARWPGKFGGHGQKVSSYYARELLCESIWSKGHEKTGLDLMSYEPSWKIDAENMITVRGVVRGARAVLNSTR